MCVQNDVSCMYPRRHCPACVYNAVVIVVVDVVIVIAIAVVVILIFVLVILAEDYLSLSTPHSLHLVSSITWLIVLIIGIFVVVFRIV